MSVENEMRNDILDSVLIGKRLKAARQEKKLTQDELADLCNCTATHICNVENGKMGISLELLFKLSIILDKSMDYFVMDNLQAKPQYKINTEIAPKLEQCDPQMLEIVDSLLERLLAYRDLMKKYTDVEAVKEYK